MTYCSGFRRKARVIYKMQAVLGRQKGGHGPRRSKTAETGDENATACVIMCLLFVNISPAA